MVSVVVLSPKIKLISMKVNFKKLNENAVIPYRASEFSGGWDVIATEIEKVSDDLFICKLGFALELPEGYKLTLVPRSSITKTHWVMQNSPGLGDEDYRGEYQIRFRGIPVDYKPSYNNGILGSGHSSSPSKMIYEEFPFKVGERIGQIYLETVISMEFNEVNELATSTRDAGGFGSTGNIMK